MARTSSVQYRATPGQKWVKKIYWSRCRRSNSPTRCYMAPHGMRMKAFNNGDLCQAELKALAEREDGMVASGAKDANTFTSLVTLEASLASAKAPQCL